MGNNEATLQQVDTSNSIIFNSNTEKNGRIVIIDVNKGKNTFDSLLRFTWNVGSTLAINSGDFDAIIRVTTVDMIFNCLKEIFDKNKYKIKEIQYWGHGGPGSISVGDEQFNIYYMNTSSVFKIFKDNNILEKDCLLWLRTCSTFKGLEGRSFALALTKELPVIVAGHLVTIGITQNKLVCLKTGEDTWWQDDSKGSDFTFMMFSLDESIINKRC